jgi:hypothetical protein
MGWASQVTSQVTSQVSRLDNNNTMCSYPGSLWVPIALHGWWVLELYLAFKILLWSGWPGGVTLMGGVFQKETMPDRPI